MFGLFLNIPRITYSEKTKYPADILGVDLKYIDNPQAHDARLETLTWGGWPKGNFQKKDPN